MNNALLLVVICLACFAVAYVTYGRLLARWLFELDANRRTPAHELEDGVDFVPTRTPVLFGHHFASIAGLGPILGPAIAVVWGWLPAVLWVMIGCIFIGAVHDLGALVVSMRFRGRTIGDVCQQLMGPRARLLALVIIFFLLALAMGAFVNVISGLFVNFNPDAIIPSFGLMIVAVGVGIAVYRFKAKLGYATAVGLVLFALLIVWGVKQPVASYLWFTSPQTRQMLEAAKGSSDDSGDHVFAKPFGAVAAAHALRSQAALASERGQADRAGSLQAAAGDVETAAAKTQRWWIYGLLTYAFLASVLPVWLLLQPRDYINSFQLYFALITLFVGLVVAALAGAPENVIDAAAFRPAVPLRPLGPGESLQTVGTAPSWLPLLFVTVACGAVSGFHSLVSSGTTVRQLNRETDALVVGYGGMLTEGVLAILVIVACVAGLGADAWQQGPYSSWAGIKGGGLPAQLNAVIRGGGNFLAHLGIPTEFGTAVLAVTVVAFALTTLDTGTRLLRFNVESICRSVGAGMLANRYFASLVAVAAIGFFGLVPAGRPLWLLFGTSNQLLAGLTLLVISVYLFQLRRTLVLTLVPMVLMLVVSIWAIGVNLKGFWTAPNLEPYHRWSLTVVSVVILLIAVWLIVEGLRALAGKPQRPAEQASADRLEAPPEEAA